MVLSVIIPAYNEAKTILQILQKVLAVPLTMGIGKEIIVVNDCSTDTIANLVSDYISEHPTENILLINHPKNAGKGAAIHTGIATASGDHIIVQDADMEYDPQDYNSMLKTLITNNLQVLYGSRFLNPRNSHSYRRFYWGGRIVTLFANILYHQKLTDEPTCYKLFDAKLLKSIPLRCMGFDFCPEITAKVAKRGIRIREIPINYYPRSIAEGKKIRWTDGILAIWTLLKYRFVN